MAGADPTTSEFTTTTPAFLEGWSVLFRVEENVFGFQTV
jgi:hypothetical protein